MSNAIAGKKALIQLGNNTPPAPPDTWEDVDEIRDIGDMPLRAAIYDVTSHGPSLYREIKPGLYEISEFTMTANYLDDSVSSQYAELYTKFLNSTISWYRLMWPDDSTHTFKGYVTDITPTTPLDDVITYNLTITIDGDVVYSSPA